MGAGVSAGVVRGYGGREDGRSMGPGGAAGAAGAAEERRCESERKTRKRGDKGRDGGG